MHRQGTCLYKGSIATIYVKRYNKIYCLKLNWYCKGLNITEVAHDNSALVKYYIVEDLQLKNSYDTWHGKSFNFLHFFS